MMIDPMEGYLEVTFKPYGYANPLRVTLAIDRFTQKAYNPLPRDRESDYEIHKQGIDWRRQCVSHERAAVQVKDRAKLTEWLAPKIASMLAEAVTSQDTVNGYDQ